MSGKGGLWGHFGPRQLLTEDSLEISYDYYLLGPGIIINNSNKWLLLFYRTKFEMICYISIYNYIPIDNCYIMCCCSVAKLFPTLCDPMDCSMPGFSVFDYLPEFAQAHVHWVSNAIQPPHPLLLPSPFAFNPPQHQGLFQWISSLHQMGKVLELQLQQQSFQWLFRVYFL